ncbi:uncharacterized protein [Physcomitrium patens]|uniref:uncharacterized protein isoform X4 n=1 Tax=Physcomitrium patens TaxID=3218 RepID=UPI000D159247|nr:uncharacterized protein LOC112276443 isoform X4 [Physcomitrium patens]|eukprot:XP_024363537.1 uncharacterized protein LOC112276443 isoform X4 [Physcomitrella patens]
MRCAQHNNFAHRLKLGENCDLVAMQTGRVACSLRVKCCQDLMVVECCCFRASNRLMSLQKPMTWREAIIWKTFRFQPCSILNIRAVFDFDE